MGRPTIPIDMAKVEQLASFGASADEIAAELGVGSRTIERRCGATLKRGAKMRDIRLRSALFKHAVRGNAPILIFMAKTCLGMRETVDPSTIVNVQQNAGGFAPAMPTREELKARLAAVDRFLAQQPNSPDFDGNGR